MWNLFANPASDILRRRVKRQQLVEVTVVEIVVYPVLYVFEINHHPFGIKSFCLAIYGDNPIVTVQVGTFAFIREIEPVAARNLHFLSYVIHL